MTVTATGTPACLVLAHVGDEAALRIHLAVEARIGRGGSRVVSAEELALAPRWVHRLDGTTVESTVELADRTVLDGRRVAVVLNRLRWAPLPHWASTPEPDRSYASAEMGALYASWLAGLPCRVVDRPCGVLCPPPRTLVERLALAGRAGFAVQRACDTTDARLAPALGRALLRATGEGTWEAVPRALLGRAPALLLEAPVGAAETLLVVGDRVVGLHADELGAPALALARLLGRSIVAVVLASDADGTLRVIDVKEWPELPSPFSASLVADLLVAELAAPVARAGR